jgi:hypothetical protein
MVCCRWPTLITFLKTVGLEPIFFVHPDPLICKDDEKWKWKTFLNWFYPFIVWIILWAHPTAVFVVALDKDRRELLSLAFFLYIQPIQYYIAFWYFRSQSKKRIYDSKSYAFTKDYDSSEYRCLPKEKTLVKMVTVISFLAVLEGFILFITQNSLDTESVFNELSSSLKVLAYITIPISLIYGRIVLVINTHIFFFSFLQQLKKMQGMRHKLRKHAWHGNQSSVAVLCFEIIDLRYTISRLIDKMEHMFISTTLLGGVAVGNVIEFKEVNYQTVTAMIIFSLMQMVFLFVIQYIGRERGEILKIVRHRRFASRYILRRNEFCQACLDIQRKDRELKDSKDSSDTAEHMDNKEDDSFTGLQQDVQAIFMKGIGGEDLDRNPHQQSIEVRELRDMGELEEVVIDDTIPEASVPEFQKRTLGTGTDSDNTSDQHVEDEKTRSGSRVFMKASDSDSLGESAEIQRQIRDLMDSKGFMDPYRLVDSGCVLKSDEFIRCIYEWCSNTGSSVDWIILNTIVNEEWTSFSIFGIEFSDGSALKKAMLVMTGIVATGSFFGGLEWIA